MMDLLQYFFRAFANVNSIDLKYDVWAPLKRQCYKIIDVIHELNPPRPLIVPWANFRIFK